MTKYDPMTCECGETIVPEMAEMDPPRRAKSWDSCNYKCECGAGYSNAKSEKARRRIFKAPENNVPLEVRSGLDDVLGRSINVLNRASKLASFCSSNSEDAVTWTVFRYLAQTGGLASVFNVAREGSPAVLLWGVPIVETPQSLEIMRRLAEVCDELREDPTSRSEPDVIIVWPHLVVVIEVKFKSPNDRRPDYPNFWKYLDDEELFVVPTRQVEEAGYYELVRNWRIGAELAQGLDLDLQVVNLGPEAVANDGAMFSALLCQTGRRQFLPLRWRDLLGRIADTPLWFSTYVAKKGLLTNWG